MRDTPRMNASQRRAQARIAAALAKTGFAMPGSITERYTRCGTPNCRCKADPPRLHGPYLQWTRKQEGKTITRLLSAEQAERYRPWIEQSARLRELLRELEALSLGIAERAEGWQPPIQQANTTRTRSSRTVKRAQR